MCQVFGDLSRPAARLRATTSPYIKEPGVQRIQRSCLDNASSYIRKYPLEVAYWLH